MQFSEINADITHEMLVWICKKCCGKTITLVQKQPVTWSSPNGQIVETISRTVRYSLPPIPLFHFFSGIPAMAVQHIWRAFGLRQNDDRGCLNALRQAYEAIQAELKGTVSLGEFDHEKWLRMTNHKNRMNELRWKGELRGAAHRFWNAANTASHPTEEFRNDFDMDGALSDFQLILKLVYQASS